MAGAFWITSSPWNPMNPFSTGVAIERNIAEWDITREIGPNEKGFPETITSPTTGSSFEGKTDRLETAGSGPQRSCVQIPNGPEFFQVSFQLLVQ